MTAENLLWTILAVVCLVAGILCILRPEMFKWMPVYRFYSAVAGEKAALVIVRLSAGLGFIALSGVLFAYAFGLMA